MRLNPMRAQAAKIHSPAAGWAPRILILRRQASPLITDGMRLSPLGDCAVVIDVGNAIEEATASRVRALTADFAGNRPAGVVDVVPAFAQVTVFYDPSQIGDFSAFCHELEHRVAHAEDSAVAATGRHVEIPTHYGGVSGSDLDAVSRHTGLTPAEVIALHSGAEYLVHAIGFAPGFPYLGGLPERLATPRRATPRARVAAGSVGIGGAQTGIYPVATPGGWNVIGRTPLRLFDPFRENPAWLHVGDRVKFQPISAEELVDATAEAAAEADPALGVHDERGGEVVRREAALEVARAGMFTTVQDCGRPNHRAAGVAVGGAADPIALRVANLLVGNPEGAAALEFTLVGPEIVFHDDSLIALGGAEFGGIPRWQPFRVERGSRLKLGLARSGYRGYLAVAGGIAVEPVLGSRSTHVRAGFGGLAGRVLRDGDRLPVAWVRRRVLGRWHIDERILPAYTSTPVLRVLPGAQAAEFDRALFAGEFTVSPQLDRMGVRLRGQRLRRASSTELLSTAVTAGTIQVPPDGQPIVLLADAQTIGGYPQVAHVIGVDLPVVAQLRPGDKVRFCEITLAEAHELARAKEHALAMLHEGLAEKLR
jgi:antagonist of KipI